MGSDSPGYINVVFSKNASHSCFLAAIKIPLFSNKQMSVKDFTKMSCKKPLTYNQTCRDN